jgi:hypothetical protein
VWRKKIIEAMPPGIEEFSEWLRLQGHAVQRTASSYWVEAGPRIWQAFPYQWVISPSEGELRRFMVEHLAIGLRYSAPIEVPQGAASYHVVLTSSEFPMAALSKKARHDVQRGLKSANIESISFERLAVDGWQLRLDTLQRQGRLKAESQAGWQRLCQSAVGLDGFEAWAAVVNGELAAALIAFTCEDCCSILYQQSRTEYLPLGVNNALAFAFTNEVLKRSPRHWIFYGLHSLDASPSVDEFKFRMGYSARPVRQRVVFHPALRPLFNPASHALLAQILHLKPGNPSIAKAEGMLRFYLIGRRPLEQQDWPEALRPKQHLGGVRAEASNPSVTSEDNPPPDKIV